MKLEYGNCWLKTGPPGRETLKAGRILSLKNWSVSFGDLPLANARAVNEPIEFPEKTLVRLINFGFCRDSLFKSCKLKAPKVPPQSKDMIRYFVKAISPFQSGHKYHSVYVYFSGAGLCS